MASLIKRFVVRNGKKEHYYAVKYRDHSGVQRWIKGYSDKTETERLARKLEDEQRAIRNGDVDPQAETRRVERAKPIDTQISDYEASLKAAGNDAGYVKSTIRDVRAFVAFGGAKSASEINKPMMDRWVNSQIEAGKRGEKWNANKTINRRVGAVQQFLGHLKSTGGVTEYTLLRYPKLPTGGIYRKRQSRALSKDEVAKLLTTGNVDRRELYEFVLKTGLRMNEARQMIPRYFDFKRQTYHLPAHIDKAGKDRTMHLHSALMPMLKRRCAGHDPEASVFTMPTKQHVIAQLKRDCKSTGVDPKYVAFHALRHTFCTLLAQDNVHPKILHTLARHSNWKTTLDFYVHFQRDDEKAALERL